MRLAAVLIDLAKNGATDALSSLLLAPAPDPVTVDEQIAALQKRLSDPFLEIDPRDGLHGVSVSPLGIVHYFRQYFFELDSFLGSPVGHVWLAPGSTVELVESSTRRGLDREDPRDRDRDTDPDRERRHDEGRTERGSQAGQPRGHQAGLLSDREAVVAIGNLTATGSVNLDKTQAMARESTHKRLREQSEKLSQELRNEVKTTFKTVTESTDVSSRRYVISNESTTDLQNFELRRKMRGVVVQVQDIGTYLCWETFVDDPGRELGLANLVHVGKPPRHTQFRTRRCSRSGAEGRADVRCEGRLVGVRQSPPSRLPAALASIWAPGT